MSLFGTSNVGFKGHHQQVDQLLGTSSDPEENIFRKFPKTLAQMFFEGTSSDFLQFWVCNT